MRIADITLQDPSAEAFDMSSLLGSPVAVQLVRYYGCLPCQQYLQQFSAQKSRFEAAGAQTLCVGGSADYQARWLIEHGVETPLLLDPDQEFRAAVEFGNIGLNLLHPKGAAKYLSSFGRGRKPMRITSDTVRTPGAVVLDANLEVAWSYEGKTLGDYPALDDFLAAATDVAAKTLV